MLPQPSAAHGPRTATCLSCLLMSLCLSPATHNAQPTMGIGPHVLRNDGCSSGLVTPMTLIPVHVPNITSVCIPAIGGA